MRPKFLAAACAFMHLHAPVPLSVLTRTEEQENTSPDVEEHVAAWVDRLKPFETVYETV